MSKDHSVNRFGCGDLLIEVTTYEGLPHKFRGFTIFDGVEELHSMTDHLKPSSPRQHAEEILQYLLLSDELPPNYRQKIADLAEYTGKLFEAEFTLEELR